MKVNDFVLLKYSCYSVQELIEIIGKYPANAVVTLDCEAVRGGYLRLSWKRKETKEEIRIREAKEKSNKLREYARLAEELGLESHKMKNHRGLGE